MCILLNAAAAAAAGEQVGHAVAVASGRCFTQRQETASSLLVILPLTTKNLKYDCPHFALPRGQQLVLGKPSTEPQDQHIDRLMT